TSPPGRSADRPPKVAVGPPTGRIYERGGGSGGGAGQHLVARRDAALEAPPRRAQADPPHAQTLGADEGERLVLPSLDAPQPFAQRARVVAGKALDVLGDEAGGLERREDAREVQRRGVGEHVALRERARLWVAVAQARDAMVEQAPTGAQELGEPRRVRVDHGVADVLDHPDAGDRV